MVAVVTGTGLGLERSSGWVLGSKGQLGNAAFGCFGENVYVNAATGNLAITRTDEILIGQGVDDVLVSAYNSLGSNLDDNHDNWRMSAQRQITHVTGTINAVNSKVTRINWDGSDELYTSNGSVYICTQGGGAYDTLSYDPGTTKWTWTDGNSRVKEVYERATNPNDASDTYFARIKSATDLDGNGLAYDYTGNLLTKVTTASGEFTTLSYDPNNNLTDIATTLSNGTILKRTHYVYDTTAVTVGSYTAYRLLKVQTDLTPVGGSIADNNYVQLIYTYDGNSTRIASISQADSSGNVSAKLTISYDANGCVAYVNQYLTDGTTATTHYEYDTVARITTITDALNHATTVKYDAKGRLKTITLPPAVTGGASQVTKFSWNADSDDITWTDPAANTVDYRYDDGHNNLTLEKDEAGNTIARFYDSSTNALLTEARYLVPDPDDIQTGVDPSVPLTTRYVYDAENHLRFVISARGEVTEYQYDGSATLNTNPATGPGNRTAAISYRQNLYAITGLAWNTPITESQMVTWVAGITNKSTTDRSDMTYDFRGNLVSVTSYEATDATTGAGLTGSGHTNTIITYTYDQFGNLLFRQTTGISHAEAFLYDGLGRFISSTDLNGATTIYNYQDGGTTGSGGRGATTELVLANGFHKLSTYDWAGRLTAYKESSSALPDATTSYFYDALGRLLRANDPALNSHYYLYDMAGRKTADIAADGSMIEYQYDLDNRLVKTIRYVVKTTASLTDGSGNPNNPLASSVRPTANSNDVYEFRVYDKASRLIQVIDGKGEGTVFVYDGLSNLVSTKSYATALAAGSITTLKNAAIPLAQSFTPGTDDRTSRNFYDESAKLIGTLDALGYFTEIKYDDAGHQVETIAYATQVASADRAAGAFSQMIADVGSSTSDRHTRWYYDGRGLLLFTLDANLHPVGFVYDAAEHLINRIDYAGTLSATPNNTLADMKAKLAATSGLGNNTDNRVSWNVYDAATGNLTFSIDPNNAVTQYICDQVDSTQSMGWVVKQIRYAATQAPSANYDWTSWAASHVGDGNNRITRLRYDQAGRLIYDIDALGYVTEHAYDPDGRVAKEIRYSAAYAVTDAMNLQTVAGLIAANPSSHIDTLYDYDPAGRLANTFDGLNICTHYDYYGTGLLQQVTTGYGSTTPVITHFDYDAAGQVLIKAEAYDPSNGTALRKTNFAYNAFGQLTDRIDAYQSTTTAPVTTHYVFDQNGQVLTETRCYAASNPPPEMVTTAFAYNSFGDVTSKTEASNDVTIATTTAYSRDILGRVTLETRAQGKPEETKCFYQLNAFGEVTDKTEGYTKPQATTTHYDRDHLGRVQAEIRAYVAPPGVPLAESTTTTQAFNAFGDLVDTIDAAGTAIAVTTHRGYDLDGRLTDERFAYVSSSNTSLSETFTVYDAYDRATDVTRGYNTAAATTTHYDYDSDSRVLSETRAYAVSNPPAEKTTTVFAYDPLGRMTDKTEANSTSVQTRTHFDIDKLGRVTDKTVAFGTSDALVTHYEYDDLDRVLKETRAYAPTNPPAEATATLYSYYLLGSVKDRTEANGTADAATTHYTWDILGRMLSEVRAYALTNPPSEITTTAYSYDFLGRMTFKTAASGTADATTTRYEYDVLSRLVDETQAYAATNPPDEKTVTHYDYDFMSRVTDKTVASGTTEASTTHYTYDALSRVWTETQGYALASPPAEMTTTTFGYDAMSRLTDRTVASNVAGDAAITHYDYNALSQMTAETDAYGQSAPELSMTLFGYDKLGNLTSKTDGRGNATTYTYDALSRVSSMTVPAGGTTNYTYDRRSNLIKTTDPRGGYLNSNYDLLDRLIQQIDQESYVTGYSYNFRSELTQVRKYPAKFTGTITDGVKVAMTSNDAVDQVTLFTRDKLGRVTDMRDGEQQWEHYHFNALSERTSFTNKLGGVTTDTYDKIGRLLQESATINWTTVGGTPQSTTITTKYTYDHRGNRTRMIEAYSLAEARTTNFAYDKLDRLIETNHDQLTYVDQNDSFTSHSNFVPRETIAYDKRGNVIQTTDAAGARTLYYYNDRNFRTAAINALGVLSTFEFDQNGNVAKQRIYDTKLSTLPTNPGGTPPAGSGTYRETLYAYDAANRLITTTVTNVLSWYDGKAYANLTGSIAIANEYDLSGNLLHTSVADGSTVLNNVWFYYDKANHRIAQLDQENYLTITTVDGDGNATREERFSGKSNATAAKSANTSYGNDTAYVAYLRTTVNLSAGNDRTTNFTYDRMGRRRSEERTGVDYATVDASTGAFSQGTASSIITYTYNALGEVATKAEASGDLTTYVYDNAGRQTQIKGPAFTDYTNTANRQQIVEMTYDGLNDLKTSTRKGAGSDGDRTTTYTYGVGGRLASTTDAAGFVTYHYYDAVGREVESRFTLVKSDGSHDTNAKAIRYDALGQVTFQATALLNGSTWTFGDSSQSQYNSFGEVIARGVNGMWQENYSYDNAGHLWKSTAGDGTTRLYAYDGNGKQTLMIASSGAALPTGYTWAGITASQAMSLLTNAGAGSVGTVTVDGMVTTISVRDKRGQETETREPLRQIDTTANRPTISHKRVYNAFGEVLQEIGARNTGGSDPKYITTYAYNKMGRLVSRIDPLVNYTDEQGGVHVNATPTETYWYDLSGRLVAVDDAAGNRTKRALLAGTGYEGGDPLVLREFRPDSSIYARAFDVFGDLRQSSTLVSGSPTRVETYTYDNLDRLTVQVHPTRPVGVGNSSDEDMILTDYYAYDELGERIAHWNSLLVDLNNTSIPLKELTDYDMQGRVSRSVDYAGNITVYGYAWSASMQTTGLATGSNAFGGWVKTTTMNNTGLSEIENIDYFGRTVGKTDYGNHVFSYTFDLAGRGVADGVGDTWTYFNTNRVASTSTPYSTTWFDFPNWHTTSGTISSTYQYDLEGNRTLERYDGYVPDINGAAPPAFGTLQNAIIVYDALNRMTSFTDTGGTIGEAATITWEYDQNGNVRHMNAVYHELDAQGAFASSTKTQDYWYKYDSMNRFVTTRGTLSGTAGSGTITRGSTGVDISYNAWGERAIATKTLKTTSGSTDSYQEEKETYTYTADGYLAQVNAILGTSSSSNPPPVTAGAGNMRASYDRDELGRVWMYKEYADTTLNPEVYTRSATYNAASQVTHDHTWTKRDDNSIVVADTYYDFLNESSPGVYAGSYGGGVVTHSYGSTISGSTTTNNDTKNTYVWWDATQQYSIVYTPNTAQPSTTQTTTYGYNANGSINNVYIGDGRARQVNFVTNAEGLILQRDEADGLSGGDPREIHYYAGGIAVGDISNNGTSDVDYVASIASHRKVPGSNAFQNGSNSSTPYADFDQSYDPINGLTYESAAARYTVQSGDTLFSIARAVWGDTSFWYMLADANGLDGSETLVAGQSLIVPNRIHNAHNSSDVFKVYDPNQIIGNTSPTAPKHHSPACGGFGQILLVIIAVVVTIVLNYFIPGAGSVVGDALLGAAEGAAGSIVAQGVGLATGIQNSFSWRGVAEAAIGGAVGGGLSATDWFAAGGVFGDLGTFGTGAVRGIIGNVVTQGVEVATGLEKHFDWSGVATAGVVGGVTNSVANGMAAAHIGDANSIRFVSGMAGAIAGAATRSLLTGKDFGDNLIAVLPDVIGNVIGTAIGNAIISGSDAANADTANEARPQAGVASVHALIDALKGQSGVPLDDDYAAALSGLPTNPFANKGENYKPLAAIQTVLVTDEKRPESESVQPTPHATQSFINFIENFGTGIETVVVDGIMSGQAIANWVDRTVQTVLNSSMRLEEFNDQVNINTAQSVQKTYQDFRDWRTHQLGPNWKVSLAYDRIVNTDFLLRATNPLGMMENAYDLVSHIDEFGQTRPITNGDILDAGVTVASAIPIVRGLMVGGRVLGAVDAVTDLRLTAEGVADEAVAAKPGFCFVAGTLVHTQRGQLPIEKIAVGEMVLSQPELGGERDYRRVTDTISFDDKNVFEIVFQSSGGSREALLATPNHPFWVQGLGWRALELVEIGQWVQLGSGDEARVVSVRDTGSTQCVFNLTIDGFHTYYVGHAGVWVHNTNCSVRSPNAAMRATANETGTYVNPLTGQVVAADGRLAADHFIPQDWIKAQPGFSDLSAADQSALLNDPLNTQGLPQSLNASKGAKMPGDWDSYKGQSLDPGYVADDAQRAVAVQRHLLEQIRLRLGK